MVTKVKIQYSICRFLQCLELVVCRVVTH